MSDQTPTPDSYPTDATPMGEAPIEAPVEAVQPYPTAPVPPAPVPPAAEAPATWPAAHPTAYPATGTPASVAPAGPAVPQTSSNAIVALILAVVSWAVCPIIAAVVALVFASMAAKEIAASGGRVQGQGLVTAARIVSWINIGIWAAILVVGILVAIALAIAASTSPNSFN